MKPIDDYVKIKANDKEYIYINTLNGAIDIIEVEVDNIFEKWKRNGINFETDYDKEIYDFMVKREYILEKDKAKKLKEDIYTRLKKELKYKQKNIESITLVLTYDCNFNCFYCYEKEDEELSNKTSKTLTKEMVDKIYNMFGENLKNVNLFGGEPLLLKNYELVKYILNKRNDLSYGITTNGYYLEEFVPILKDKKNLKIQVTLDGPKEKHDKRRVLFDGSPTFEKISRGIIKALDNNISIKIRMNIDDSNYNEAKDFRENVLSKYAQYSDILSFELYPLFQNNNLKKYNLYEKMYNEDIIFKENGEVDTSINYTLYTALPIINNLLSNAKYKPQYVFCNASLGNRYFDPNGDIYTCSLAVGNKELSLGKYYPEYNIEHEENWLNRTVETIDKCRECKMALLCGGGCPLAAYKSTGSFSNGTCYQTKFYLEKILPLMCNKYKK